MARETSCLGRISAGTAMGGVVGAVFGTYDVTIFKVPGGWAYEANVLRPTNHGCWQLYNVWKISVKFVPCKVSW